MIDGFGASEEQALHQIFAASHVRGEWFTTSPELEALIRANARVTCAAHK